MKWLLSGSLALILSSCSPSQSDKDELWQKIDTHLSKGQTFDSVDPAACKAALTDLDKYIMLAPNDPDGYRAKRQIYSILYQSEGNPTRRKEIRSEEYESLKKMFELVDSGKKFTRFQGTYNHLRSDCETLKKELGK